MTNFLRCALIGLVAMPLLINNWTWRNNSKMNYFNNIGVHCGIIYFEDFHSQSFVPNGLHISYHIENGVGVDYNITAFKSFPGKILISIFMRKAMPTNTNGSASNEKSLNVLKYKNLDFCKIIEMVQNFSTITQNETFFKSTFITSCPLTRGFYYIKNATFRTEMIPAIIARGIYWLQIELVQIFGEVTKLMNLRVKCHYEPARDGVLFIN